MSVGDGFSQLPKQGKTLGGRCWPRTPPPADVCRCLMCRHSFLTRPVPGFLCHERPPNACQKRVNAPCIFLHRSAGSCMLRRYREPGRDPLTN
jgi:hypothetical protein